MITLQIIWFILIAILFIGYSALDGFDLGSGFWHLQSNSDTKQKILGCVGPFWDGNEVWLITAGGALFAAFPQVYAKVFSGFYLAMLLVVFGIIFRAIAIEIRDLGEECWKKRWDLVYSFASLLVSLLLGVALGNIIRGLALEKDGSFLASNFFYLLNPFSIMTGILVTLIFILHSFNFLGMKIKSDFTEKHSKINRTAWYLFFIIFIVVEIWILTTFVKTLLISSIIASSLTLLTFIVSFIFFLKKDFTKAFWSSFTGIGISIISAALAIYPNWLYDVHATNSLTIFNSSSSYATLLAMLIIAAIGMPIVIGYTIFIYRIFK